MDFLIRLEQSGFATWVREGGSIWSYPAILFAHTLGLGTLAGLNAAIDLRLLGFAPQIPVAPLKRLYPVMWTAFGITAASGLVLLITDASAKLASPVFYVKMVFVALALVNLQMLKSQAFRESPGAPPALAGVRVLAVTSLLLWIGATTAGRLMAYLGPVARVE